MYVGMQAASVIDMRCFLGADMLQDEKTHGFSHYRDSIATNEMQGAMRYPTELARNIVAAAHYPIYLAFRGAKNTGIWKPAQ